MGQPARDSTPEERIPELAGEAGRWVSSRVDWETLLWVDKGEGQLGMTPHMNLRPPHASMAMLLWVQQSLWSRGPEAAMFVYGWIDFDSVSVFTTLPPLREVVAHLGEKPEKKLLESALQWEPAVLILVSARRQG